GAGGGRAARGVPAGPGARAAACGVAVRAARCAALTGGAQEVLRLGRHEFAPGKPLVMGIVNRTPDSFYRPGITWDESAAMDRVHQVIAEGADIVDVGGGPAPPGAPGAIGGEIPHTPRSPAPAPPP